MSVHTHDCRVDTDAGRLHARQWRPSSPDADAATPFVLFHDSLGCVELWRDFPARLAQVTGRRVIAYDRLGFGRSDPHPGTLDRHFVHDEANGGFRAVREQLGIADFIGFGHSVGGGMAIACAAAYADHCRGLITESAQAFVEDRTVQGIRAAQQQFAQPGQLERLRKYHGDKAAWVLHAWIDTWLAADFADWNLDDTLRHVACPVLVLHGEHDEFGSFRHPERIAALAAGPASMHILADCGHVPHREQAEVVLGLIGDWLAGAHTQAGVRARD